jgi:hypothetical protein
MRFLAHDDRIETLVARYNAALVICAANVLLLIASTIVVFVQVTQEPELLPFAQWTGGVVEPLVPIMITRGDPN